MGLATQWIWDEPTAKSLNDLLAYHLSEAPFAGGIEDVFSWWIKLPIRAEDHPLKTVAVTLFSIVPHSAEVERLFSDLGGIQGVKWSNLAVETFEQLTTLWSHYSFNLWSRA